MIKQIGINNLYNFKEEVYIDFSIAKVSKDITYKTYGKIAKSNIGIFSLIYGKNNVGKSNFYRIIKEAFTFIITNRNFLSINKASLDKPAAFEITLVSSKFETRYGFEFEQKNGKKVLIDEWMYTKLDNSTRETLIFDRSSKRFNKNMKKSDRVFMENVDEDELYLYYLKKIENETIIEFIKSIENDFVFLSCIDDKEFNLQYYLDTIIENPIYIGEISNFLKSMDTNVESVSIKKLDKNFSNYLLNFKNMLAEYDEIKKSSNDDENIKEYESKIEKYFVESEFSGHLVENKEFFGISNNDGDDKVYAVSFIDRFGNVFDYSDMSSGTKQMFKILLLTCVTIHKKSGVLLFDEVESGLHIDVVNSYFSYLNQLILKLNNNVQVISSTHQEKLLDLPFVSKEAMVLIKDGKGSPIIDYISNYNIRKDQLISKRYLLDAFESNPNILMM